ncbi:MAG: class I SAM-dependent methyltransferase [Chromatiales bacterium]|nr:class I SAM-dependent methyltransferase [Chromatiales bacterium]
MSTDFQDVTEMAGEPITSEQLDRLCHRYAWASRYCAGKDVVELACGTGPGIGVLNGVAGSFEAGDFSGPMIERVRQHYGGRVVVRQFDAQAMPYPDQSKDVLIIFEALYYLPDVPAFIRECRRVLRPGGKVLIATANKDLPDFNPSPYSHLYLGVAELGEQFAKEGFETSCFGYLSVSAVSAKQRLLRPVKQFVVASGLMPKTMRGKQLLKRLVFGKPVPMPAEIAESSAPVIEPAPLPAGVPDRSHKVIYCVATLRTA